MVVRGYVTLAPEGHSLYESRQLNVEFKRRWDSDKNFDPRDYVKYCLTIANPDFLYRVKDEIDGQTITMKGKFIDNYLEGRLDLGACPLPTAIIVDEADLRTRYPSIFHGK